MNARCTNLPSLKFKHDRDQREERLAGPDFGNGDGRSKRTEKQNGNAVVPDGIRILGNANGTEARWNTTRDSTNVRNVASYPRSRGHERMEECRIVRA